LEVSERVALVSFGSVNALPNGTANSAHFLGPASIRSNLSDDTSCGLATGTDRQRAPNLGAHANNAGPTLTRVPQPGSPLIDSIPAASCHADGASGVTADQRGITRPQGAGCDIGAVEVAVARPPRSS
jgi:hypothetical protein